MAATENGSGPNSRQGNRVQISTNKKPLNFYLTLSRRIMHEHGEVELSALGMAISNLVTVSEILKKEGWATEKSLKTGLEVLKAEGETRSSSKPKMMVVLGQGPDFERLYAEHPPPPRGAKAGAATAPAEEAPAA